MTIRLLQSKKNFFWIQQSKKIFGNTYWITLRDRKKFFKSLLYYVIWYLTFPFVVFGIWTLLSVKVNFLEDSLELLFGCYKYCAGVFSIIFSLKRSKIIEYYHTRLSPDNIPLAIKYNGEIIKIPTTNLVKSGKRTIFGKIKDVYYMSNKDLRKQKLEKLNSLFK